MIVKWSTATTKITIATNQYKHQQKLTTNIRVKIHVMQIFCKRIYGKQWLNKCHEHGGTQ